MCDRPERKLINEKYNDTQETGKGIQSLKEFELYSKSNGKLLTSLKQKEYIIALPYHFYYFYLSTEGHLDYDFCNYQQCFHSCTYSRQKYVFSSFEFKFRNLELWSHGNAMLNFTQNS